MMTVQFPKGFGELLAALAIIGFIATVATTWWIIVKVACWLYVHYN